MISALTLVLGLVILVGGGALLVRGASEIAAGFGVSPIMIGLTVIAFGTSAPELVVNVVGAVNGATDLAFGNVIGSNISNVALVLGAAALMSPITIHSQLVRREIPLLLLGTTGATVMALDVPLENGAAMIGRSDAAVLLLFFCIFLYVTLLDFVRNRQADPLLTEIHDYPLLATRQADPLRWPMAVGGIVLLYFGGELTVDSGVELATAFGVSETVIGLFVVAIGTSMPELVTSIIAAAKGESDLALGNVVGSNMFNTLVVLPASGMITPIAIPPAGLLDLAVSWGLVAVLIPVFFFGQARLNRGIGALLVLAFFAYAVARIGTAAG